MGDDRCAFKLGDAWLRHADLYEFGVPIHPDASDDHRANPVGSYRRVFTLPQEWSGDRVILHFGGVSSAYYVWVNGQRVGYAEDSRLPSEFDITDYVQDGENLMAVQVYRWSDGSYLEDQDHWRLSGIHREVYLIAQPTVAIEDFFVRTDLDQQLCRRDDSRFVHESVWLKRLILRGGAWRRRCGMRMVGGCGLKPMMIPVKRIVREKLSAARQRLFRGA